MTGPIAAEKIASSIASHQSKTNIKEHSIFLGQVESTSSSGNQITGLSFETDIHLADEVLHEIREKAFSQFDLTCLHIYHSLGEVKVGEIYLFVFTSSAINKVAAKASSWLVEEIQSKAPISVTEVE